MHRFDRVSSLIRALGAKSDATARPGRTGWALLLAAAVFAGACSSSEEGGISDEMSAEGQRLFGDRPTQPADAGLPEEQGEGVSAAAKADAGWAIAVLFEDGPGHESRAARKAEAVRGMEGFSDARVRREGSGSAVVVGNFSGPLDPKAQQELSRVKGLVVGKARPFAAAFLVPPNVQDEGSVPEWALSRARERYGSRAVYTLQIAAYDPGPNASESQVQQAKRAAEEAVRRLRSEGKEAFYHHDRRYSVVTIGVFSTADYDERSGRIGSGELLRLKEEYPYNLVNGMEVLDKGSGRKQPSVLVHIPESPRKGAGG